MKKNNDRLAITFWGVRGSTPCAQSENMMYGGNTTCLQIDIPQNDELVILDSGTGIRKLGDKFKNRSKKITGRIFITHPHWDHIQGFPFFKPIYESKNQFNIHLPAQEDGGCKEILSGHLTETFFPVTLEMIDAHLTYVTQPRKEQQYNGYSMAFMTANHSSNTAIYKLRTGGRTIIFCPDNELNPAKIEEGTEFYTRLTEFCKHADVLIHDAQYSLESYKNKRGWGHSAWEVVVDFARRAEVKNLFLTHHDPDSTDQQLIHLDEKLQADFSGQFDSIQLAKEGDTFRI